MPDYSEWEQEVIEIVADDQGIAYSDASGIVERQNFFLQQAWGMAMDAAQTAEKILAESSSAP